MNSESRSTCAAFSAASRSNRSEGGCGAMCAAIATTRMKAFKRFPCAPGKGNVPQARLLDQAMLHRVVDEVHVGVERELLEDAAPIGAHRARREVHLLGDLLQRLAAREEPH